MSVNIDSMGPFRRSGQRLFVGRHKPKNKPLMPPKRAAAPEAANELLLRATGARPPRRNKRGG